MFCGEGGGGFSAKTSAGTIFLTVVIGHIRESNKRSQARTLAPYITASQSFFILSTAKELGYNYEIWIYDQKGNCIEQYT